MIEEPAAKLNIDPTCCVIKRVGSQILQDDVENADEKQPNHHDNEGGAALMHEHLIDHDLEKERRDKRKELDEKRGDKQMVAQHDGRVIRDGYNVAVVYEVRDEREYEIPSAARLLAEDGARVEAGQQLTEGSKNPHRILRILGREATQVYLLREIQKVYRSQGVPINDKHFEVIIRKMLSKVQITAAGDTDLLPGELVDRIVFAETNENVTANSGCAVYIYITTENYQVAINVASDTDCRATQSNRVGNITIQADCLASSYNAAIDCTVDRYSSAGSPEVTINGAINNDGIGTNIEVVVNHLFTADVNSVSTAGVESEYGRSNESHQQYRQQTDARTLDNIIQHVNLLWSRLFLDCLRSIVVHKLDFFHRARLVETWKQGDLISIFFIESLVSFLSNSGKLVEKSAHFVTQDKTC